MVGTRGFRHARHRLRPADPDPDDVETLQDLIVGAYNDAAEKVAAFAQSQLGSLGALASGLDESLGF